LSNRTNVVADRRDTYYYERVREAGPRYESFDLPSAELALNFVHTYDLFLQRLGRTMAQYGLSKSMLNILMLLRHGPADGMQLHDLGELLLVSRANITGLINHLEAKGYVKRVIDMQDRRARFARITRKAEALLDEFMPIHYRRIRALLGDLSGEEKQTLIRLLLKVRKSINAHAPEGEGKESIAYPT
jgi:MarR family transcriptional regulator, 2-MHQ and catechol-resistance regulon repressor